MDTEAPSPAPNGVIPIFVALYSQTHHDPRRPLPAGGLTRPGKLYIVAQLAPGAPTVVWSGPYGYLGAAQAALKATPVRSAEHPLQEVAR